MCGQTRSSGTGRPKQENRIAARNVLPKMLKLFILLLITHIVMRGYLCSSCGGSAADIELELPQVDEAFFRMSSKDHKGFETLLLKNVCMKGSTIVIHSLDHDDGNNHADLPSFASSGFPNTYDASLDEAGSKAAHPLRPTRKLECRHSDLSFRFPTYQEVQDIQPSDFTNCTLPVVIFNNWPHNFGENFANVVWGLHTLVSVRKVMNRQVTLLQASPCHLSLQEYHLRLLQPFSDKPVGSWDAFSKASLDNDPIMLNVSSSSSSSSSSYASSSYASSSSSSSTSSTSSTGHMHGNHPPLCFARLALLGIHGMKGGHVYQGAQEVLEYYRSRNMIPTDDKVFSRSSDSQVLKILFLDRPPPLLPNASTIARNLSPNASSNTSGSSMIVANQPLSFNEDDPELQWMKRINLSLPAQFKGRPIFPSTRQILNQASVTDECNAHNWSSVLPLHGKWKGVECRSYITKDLLHDMSAMQEVDVLISLHSSGEMNGLFMRKDTQKIQLRPKELGTTFRYYARYWVELCERSQFPFQCFFVNFEDDDSWEPGIHERLGYPSMADIATRRDRHLWLDFASLVKVMREILPIQGNRDEYFKRWQRCHVTYNVWGKGNITYGSHRSIDSAKVVRDGVTYNSDGFDMATNQCPR